MVGERESFLANNPFSYVSTCATITILASKISFTFHILKGVVVEGHALVVLSLFFSYPSVVI
jgi:hypothetical protein